MEHAHSNDGTDGGEPFLSQAQGNENATNTFQGKQRSGMWSKLRDIPVHGDPITGKANNTIRIYFENVDGFVIPDGHIYKKHKNKYKQKYLSLLMSRLEVDVYGGAETRLQ